MIMNLFASSAQLSPVAAIDTLRVVDQPPSLTCSPAYKLSRHEAPQKGRMASG